MLRPMEYLPKLTLETVVAQQILKDAAQEDIPLCADVEQMRHGPANIVLRHYDLGKDLSLAELRVVQQISKVAATKRDASLHYTLESLRFSVELKPKRERDRSKEKAETQGAIDKYLRLCRPEAEYDRKTDDILAEWRYLTWPIHCHC